MSRQFWSETLSWATASGTAITNTTTETILFPNITIPANFMQDGRVLSFFATGAWGTVITAAKTLNIKIRWGGVAGTVLAQTVSVALGTAAQGGGASRTAVWTLAGEIQTRSNGSSGTLFTSGLFTLNTAATPTLQTVTDYGLSLALASGSTGGTTPVAVTADLTADTALSITATWGTADAANSIIGHTYTLKAEN